MGMDRDTLTYLAEELGPNAVNLLEIDGHHYVSTTKGRALAIPPAEPTAGTLQVTTLNSFVLYLKSALVDGLKLDQHLIHVVDPGRVDLLGALQGRHRLRETVVSACAEIPAFAFDQFISQERFVIGCRAKCVDPEERADGDPDNDVRTVIKVASRLSAKSEVRAEDDGLSQAATIVAGVETLEEIWVPNPVRLRARRTFVEVEQPLAPFILRINAGPAVGLWEADGGAWRLAAGKAVAEWLGQAIKSIGVDPVPPILW